MSKIITIAHQKGGVGKSTLALNLALCFKDQLRVSLIDADLQGSLYHIKDDFPGLDILTPDKISEIPKLNYDLVIVDTPPYLSNRLNELFSYSDFILVPTKAGLFDLMSVKSTLALIRFAQAQNQKIKAGIIINMIKPRSGLTEEVATLLSSLGTPVLKTRIFDRVSYARSSITSGVFQGTDEKAKAEVSLLAEEIVNLLSF